MLAIQTQYPSIRDEKPVGRMSSGKHQASILDAVSETLLNHGTAYSFLALALAGFACGDRAETMEQAVQQCEARP